MAQIVKPEVIDPGIQKRLAPDGAEHAAAGNDLDTLGRVAIDAGEHVASAFHHVRLGQGRQQRRQLAIDREDHQLVALEPERDLTVGHVDFAP